MLLRQSCLARSVLPESQCARPKQRRAAGRVRGNIRASRSSRVTASRAAAATAPALEPSCCSRSHAASSTRAAPSYPLPSVKAAGWPPWVSRKTSPAISRASFHSPRYRYAVASTMTAPTTPGLHYLRFRYAQDYACNLDWWGVDGAPTQANDFGVIYVKQDNTCSSGAPLASSCDPCTAKVCEADPYCCDVEWDNICVAEVNAFCGATCN
jgi:hypothetical protein